MASSFPCSLYFPSVATRYQFADGQIVIEHSNYGSKFNFELLIFHSAVERSNLIRPLVTRPLASSGCVVEHHFIKMQLRILFCSLLIKARGD